MVDSVTSASTTLWNWLTSWPDTLAGVVIGSFFTLAGVVLTNRTNLRNMRLQLEHDRCQREKERALSMRRDIYIGASEAISAALSTIGRFGDLSLEHAELMSDYRSKSSQIAKIHIVATEATAIQFVAFTRALGAVFVKLSIERRRLLALRSIMQSHLEQMRNHQAARDQFLERFKHFNVEGAMDDRRLEVLTRGFDFEQEGAAAAATAHDEVMEQLRPQHLAFAELCQAEEVRLAALLLPVVASIRTELEQPIDVELYSQALSGKPIATRADLEALFGVTAENKET